MSEIIKIAGRRCMVTTFRSEKAGEDGGSIDVHCGVYENAFSTREEWTGESLGGYVPMKAFLRWAYRRKFLKWVRR